MLLDRLLADSCNNRNGLVRVTFIHQVQDFQLPRPQNEQLPSSGSNLIDQMVDRTPVGQHTKAKQTPDYRTMSIAEHALNGNLDSCFIIQQQLNGFRDNIVMHFDTQEEFFRGDACHLKCFRDSSLCNDSTGRYGRKIPQSAKGLGTPCGVRLPCRKKTPCRRIALADRFDER